jgi:hypothetical protein
VSFKAILEANLKTAALSLTNVWSKTAQDAGWPDDLHSQVSITSSGSGVGFNYPADIANEVFDTEHGSVGKSPKAAMRSMDQINKNEVKKAVYKSLSEDLSNKGLF